MDKDISSNPFAALFAAPDHAKAFSEEAVANINIENSRSVNEAATTSSGHGSDTQEDFICDDSPTSAFEPEKEINMLGETIFRVSLKQDPEERCDEKADFFQDIGEIYSTSPMINISNLKHIIFEVITLDRHAHDFEISHKLDSEKDRHECADEIEKIEVVSYLYASYCRCKAQQEIYLESTLEEVILFLKESMEVIILNARMCFQQPELYQFQDFASQFVEICLEENLSPTDPNNRPCKFLHEVVADIESNTDQGSLSQSFQLILEEIKLRLTSPDMSIVHKDVSSYVRVLHFFTTTPGLARMFLSLNTPEPSPNFNGKMYEMTALGAALSLSILPRAENGPFQFFSSPSNLTKKEVDMVEGSVWRATEDLVGRIHRIFVDLMKVSPEMKHYTLRWLGLCIQGNAGRGKIWTNNVMFVSDAFAVNLTHVLLLLSLPFSVCGSWKLMKIQPTYSKAVANGDKEMMTRSIHLLGLQKETCLVPLDDAENEEEDETFTFITDCFFITQKAIQVFLQPVIERLLSINRNLHQIQRLYNEVMQQAQGNEEPVRNVKDRMEKAMTIYLNRKAAVTNPDFMSSALKFQAATASWLSTLGTVKLPKYSQVDAQSKMPVPLFPLPDDVPSVIAYIPEFVVENIFNIVIHAHRFDDSALESNEEALVHFMTLILVFMGSPKRMKNPHLRAQLAEMQASLMPIHDQEQPQDRIATPQFHREKLFKTHQFATFVPETLMHVFVSIEMTGESVAFEQKFNYRRPMYSILKYIWDIPVHRAQIMKLAELAEKNILCSDAPLFLRFINLLVNDATFLLDEALIFMGQIKGKLKERDRGDWRQLSEAQRHQEESNLQQTTRLAQYHNVMSNSTINTIRLISTEIHSIFCHPTFVDRMAAMLNYFLVRLVGPKQKEFSVKDKQNYDFKPQETVSNICAIYLNLQNSSPFCEAVYQDERSYTHELFSQATQVLERIGESPQTIVDFMTLDDKIKERQILKRSEEEALVDAPEEFLDPIMGTLMLDPVMLPASKNIVDRNIIARHILSDQTDPFNRQPLSLDMVIPQTELKAKIDAWIKDRISK